MPKSNLKEVIKTLDSRLAYRQQDLNALEISRSLAAGNLGDDKQYAKWAAITDDPLVVVNYVKTYVTLQVSKLSSAPFRPKKQNLFELGQGARFDSRFTKIYNDVMNDGYSYIAIGTKDSKPQVTEVDARYIMHNGEDDTLKDATDVVVFEVVPLSASEKEEKKNLFKNNGWIGKYVLFSKSSERVRVTHYRKDKDGVFMDFYDEDYDKPTSMKLDGLDRIPVVRFVGERIELDDKKWHYRGLYYVMASVLKAMWLSGTKINTRTASSDDDNYITTEDAIANDSKSGWTNSGTKQRASVDQNGNPIPDVQFIPHDNEFLLKAFETWKGVVSDMLGPIVASGSEAVTRDEVQSRNEVKDAISNTYLSRMADSIEEVYRIVQMFVENDTADVVIQGGYLDAMRRQKDAAQVIQIYQYAKEGGLNTDWAPELLTELSDLESGMKEKIVTALKTDPYKSPQVIQLQQTVNQLNQTIQQQNTQIALLRLQATQRLERQKEFIDSTERTNRLKIALDQWKEEQKQTQEARMEVLKKMLEAQDYEGALQVVAQIESEDTPILTDKLLNTAANIFSDENAHSVQNALSETTQPVQQPMQQQPTVPFAQAVPHEQKLKPVGTPAMPTARPAVTTFNDA